MQIISQHAMADSEPDYSVSLPFELRQKARFIAPLSNGIEAGFQLERGKVLSHGDKLLSEQGAVILVIAQDEEVSTAKVSASDLARVCYHLGNRHVPLQISETWCRYQRDHVLDDMVQQLGGKVTHELAPFHPESGAYLSGHSHR